MAHRIFFDEKLYVSESRKVALSILGFIVLYMFLFLFTIGVAVLAGFAGIMLLASKAHFITLGIFISLVLFGLFIIYFMVKFLFVKQDTTDQYRVEVTAHDEPALFALIENIAREVGTDSPRKIYLSHRVNASVFYNSFSFGSLFLPIRKNLEIGLGLFNTLNVSELSSIIAHEFGHFSQKSMKFGPYIYHANRVIYNMLYENEAWENSVTNLGNKHWLLKIFSGLSLYYAQFVKAIMQKVYELINVRYMSLSRQMEFHADTISVQICGTQPFKTAMLKLEWIDAAMNETLDTLTAVSEENMKSKNLFNCQQFVLKELATINRVNFIGDTIDVKFETENEDRYRPRVKIEDQWASHPLTTERIENAEALNISREVDNASCWTLLSAISSTQERITQQMYNASSVQVAGELEEDEFIKRYRSKIELYSYPEIYKGYYDNRNISQFDIEKILPENTSRNPFELVLKQSSISPGNKINGLSSEINLLKAIESENIKVKYFDFDGVKNEAHRSFVYRKQLEEELENFSSETNATDKWIYDFCFAKSNVYQNKLKGHYEQIWLLQKMYNDFEKETQETIDLINSIYGNMQLTWVNERVDFFRNERLSKVVGFFKSLQTSDGLLSHYPLDTFSKKLNEFTKAEYSYFDGATLFNDQFNHLNLACYETLRYINHCIISETRNTLKFQEEIANSLTYSSYTAPPPHTVHG